ncbi:hypothetical protein JOQ06_025958 [Pogonophryne albipinna]|uniref:Ewing's tumor-associated antigen 1 n=1 Tax=Pogonophryne albipinna TaxID=1090488 RepID=A0AAD6A6X9_9TELE|nr:hypothetical protein JOQ06_025958 [Pogonophryne albipinna]
MNRGRVEAPSGQPVKTNRLRRSFRQTQNTQTAGEQDSPIRPKLFKKFKTPTRIPRSRTGVFSAESPHNDSDFQQDIIWDPTSPLTNRFGKKAARKQPVRVVNISDIVNRIAPKHGRPKVAEPTLQQWIGDAIPCTPDVQVPKHKRKSPRLNTVDDLLKLAKQFDFNMFRQEEDEEEELKDLHQHDILDQNDFSPPLPGNQPPAVRAGPDVQLHLMDQHMEDDLDFLFDGPTQHLSGNLSQVLSAQPSQAKPAAKEASGKTSASSHTPIPVVPTSNTKDDFDDDWENDDLLNDSLVLEMTQNPHKFISPKHASTQNQPSQVTFPRESQRNVVQSAVSEVEKDNVRQRASFKLEPNPNFHVKLTQTDTWENSNVDSSSKKAVVSTPAVSEHQEEDLSIFFESEPVWDDLADDDLLCEMCEDMENQMQNVPKASTKRPLPTGPVSNQRASLQPYNQQTFIPKKPTPTNVSFASGRAAGSSLAAGFVCNVGAQMTNSFRSTQVKNSSGSTNSSMQSGGNHREKFTFKKPNNSVSTVTSNDVGKCSAAEIALKKQQAMEKRRQRLQAQNLRAPT